MIVAAAVATNHLDDGMSVPVFDVGARLPAAILVSAVMSWLGLVAAGLPGLRPALSEPPEAVAELPGPASALWAPLEAVVGPGSWEAAWPLASSAGCSPGSGRLS